ncbi:MAG: alpha-ketoglutarate-dependent dioxygenase AlkB [Pseudomonadales bacterium]|nr:alpha-ketoglutarate-dependent dioxygenase AlkB [Pseudomonadales bacterium]
MMTDLFVDLDYSSAAYQSLKLQDAEVRLFPNFFSANESDHFFNMLLAEIDWCQEEMKMYGRIHKLPRLMAWYGDSAHNLQYEFSGIRKNAIKWSEDLLQIKKRIQPHIDTKINSVLLNLYRDEKDGVAWHSDDEPELGRAPTIASISFGQEREFQLKHKKISNLRHSMILPNGSLLIMSGSTQRHWQHQIPKRTKGMTPRINLTFRTVMRMRS